MRWFRRSQKSEVRKPVEEPKRVLTGIEKMELEEKAREATERSERESAERLKIAQRIVQLEAKIAPELAELRQLRSRLNPFAAMPADFFNHYSALANLCGGQQPLAAALMGALSHYMPKVSQGITSGW